MSEREWIFLVVPIILNGILVYFFQYIVSVNIKRKARLQHNRYKLLEEFHKRLINLHHGCRMFRDSLYAKYSNNVAEMFNKEMFSFRELKLFYLLHENMLTEYNATVTLIFNEAMNVHREMIRIQTDYNGHISSETMVAVSEHHNKLAKILEQAIDICCRDISKIYL